MLEKSTNLALPIRGRLNFDKDVANAFLQAELHTPIRTLVKGKPIEYVIDYKAGSGTKSGFRVTDGNNNEAYTYSFIERADWWVLDSNQ